MVFTTKDRAGIVELQKLGKTAEGRAALDIIDRICLRDEIAYVPGNKFGQTEFRCGIQQAGKLIHNIVELKVDWDEIEKREREIKNGEKEYGI